ncbi:MAG: MFS transporter [Actinomycetales bacterium]
MPAVRSLRSPAVLREEPQYRLLFGGQMLSILGDRVTSVVLPFAVLSIGGGVTQVALVSAAQFLPFVVLALPAGVWADRADRKRILIASDTARLVTQLCAGLLLITGHATVGVLAALVAVYGAADAFFAPAFTGLLPATVRPENLQPANALRGLSYSVGSIAGPALAGLLVALGGPGTALLFDAATFVLSVGLLVPLRPRVGVAATDSAIDLATAAAGAGADVAIGTAAETSTGAETSTHFWASLRAGWAEVRRRSWVLAFLAAMAAYHAIVLPSVFVLGPVIAQTTMQGATSWAIVTTGFGIGAVLGDLLLLRWRPSHALRVASLMLIGASCQAVFIGSGLGAWAIGGLELLAGVCVTATFTLWETSLQEHIPSGALSRVSSYDYLTTTGVIPLGNVVVGTVSAAVGLHPTLVAMSVIGVLASAAVATVPAVRALPRGAATITSEEPADGSDIHT